MQGFSAPAFENISGGLGHLECSTGFDVTETRGTRLIDIVESPGYDDPNGIVPKHRE
jgi:hypothetical protein